MTSNLEKSNDLKAKGDKRRRGEIILWAKGIYRKKLW
jgi:hypothetical protein